jgi:hypothetical protein
MTLIAETPLGFATVKTSLDAQAGVQKRNQAGVTVDLYSHVMATMQQDAAAKIDAAFWSAKIAPESMR